MRSELDKPVPRASLRFFIALLVQLALLFSVVSQRFVALFDGRDVTLETTSIDPYDPFSGYYVELRYAVERAAERAEPKDGPVWLVLREGVPAWQLLRAQVAPPGQGEVAVRARVTGGVVRIEDASRFQIPEALRSEVELKIGQVDEPPLVDLRVGSEGNVVLRRLRVGQTVYDGTAPSRRAGKRPVPKPEERPLRPARRERKLIDAPPP